MAAAMAPGIRSCRAPSANVPVRGPPSSTAWAMRRVSGCNVTLPASIVQRRSQSAESGPAGGVMGGTVPGRPRSDLVGGADDDFGDGPAAGAGDDVLDGFGDVVGVQLLDVGEAGGHAVLDGRLLVADQLGPGQARLDDAEADVTPGVLLPPGLG